VRVNIYIRKENEELWNGLADKSDWVNRMLRPSGKSGQTFSPPSENKVAEPPNARVHTVEPEDDVTYVPFDA